MTSFNRDVPDASTETFSFTDSSMGGNPADSSLSWGMQIIPQQQQQQQQRKPNTSASNNTRKDFIYQTPINLNLNPKLKFKSRIEPVATMTIVPPSPSPTDKQSIEKHLLHLPQQVLQSIVDDLQSSKPSHSASQTVIPLLPLLDLHPGKSHGSFRERGHTRKILNTWLGIELQRTDFHFDGFSQHKDRGAAADDDRDKDRERKKEVTFSLPTLIQSKAQIREMRLMQAIRNGERIREREEKEEKREEKRKRRLLKGKTIKKKDRVGERDSRKNIDHDDDDQVIKMEVDDEETDQDQLESNDQPSSSSTSTSLNPPTPWDLAIQARRRTARLQLRNDLTQLKPLMESLTILDSISSAEEWSLPFLRPPQGARAGSSYSSRGSTWPDGDASASGRDYNISSNDGLELDQRMRIQRERERERNGVYDNINASSQTETTGMNHQDSNQRSNPSSTRRNLSTNTNRSRSIRTVPDLMRESWHSTSTNSGNPSSSTSMTLR